MNANLKFAIFFALFFVVYACNGQIVGDSCTARTGSAGTCTFLGNCPVALSELAEMSMHPTTCGFEGMEQIICCPNPKSASTTTRTPIISRLSQQKCAEYGKLLRDRDNFQCDIGTIPYTLGGDVAFLREFPHVARLGYVRRNETTIWACGGSLISDEFVLTAAHCVLPSRFVGSVKFVSLGDYHIEKEAIQRIQVGVAEVIIYPDFNGRLKYNDIALLRLDRKIDFNLFVRPACLADISPPSPSDPLIATGWKYLANERKVTNILIKPTVELYSQEECNSSFPSVSSDSSISDGIVESQICAGNRNRNTEICNGSGGAPLQVLHPQACMYEVLGVSSFGKACSLANGGPEVYTRVSHYLDWIEQNVWPNQ